ncbi:unnamed protein product [Kluyveromyces dobzhanskii CBS 2104]|uniref:WGS project CCBQ000000000 data, contig 00058 n=1 Tax=Kluyveromyces dobzhanskii CBS 2104 TaxID=1427455 RepID=A0A0A8LBY8_9SACH|nr:unnamed protein product [Kluyveromyces dobzhanskii CBS 2104]
MDKVSFSDNSVLASNRSLKSSTKSGNIVMQDGSETSDMSKVRNVDTTHSAEGMYENEPLLERDRLGKASHRNLGMVAPEPVSHSNAPVEDDFSDDDSELPRDPSDLLYSVRRDYRSFIHKSKTLLNIMIFVNTLWLVTTFISDFFFNINFLRSRITSFQDMTLIFVSIVANSLTLWFNKMGFYSTLDQFLNVILFSLTLFNLLINLLVTYIRQRIGLLGVCTYLWAAVTFAVSAVLDQNLLYFNTKFHPNNYADSEADNDDLSAHPNGPAHKGISNRHTITEWVSIGFRTTVKGVLLVFFVLFTMNNILFSLDSAITTKQIAQVSTEANAATYDAFHWADADHTYQIHLKCYGDVFSKDDSEENKQPIVLFEHGGADTAFLSGTWIQELYHLNRVHRYCVYERPGYGLSDSPPAPVSIAMMADALKHVLLKEAKIKGPFTTVGYDLGGLFTQVFTAKNIDLVESMLLVESWHPDLLLKNYISRLLPGDDSDDPEDYSKLPDEINRHNGFVIWWRGILSTFNIKLQTSWLLAHHGSKERIYGRDMMYQGKYLRVKLLESVTSSLLSYKDVLNSMENLKEVKVSVVSSNELIKKSAQWGNWQRELSKLSSKTQEWKIVDGGHQIYKYGLGKQQTQDVLLRLIDEKDKY